MAEERNLAVARAADADDTDSTKAELQRRMEEARESITQTVTEIKDTVANQYQAVRDTVTEALDWREQYRKRPVAFSIGALSAGFILGYAVAGTFKGDDYDDEEAYDNRALQESDAYETTGAQPAKLASSPYEARALAKASRYSAPSGGGAQSAASGSYGSSAYAASAPAPSASLSETANESYDAAESEPDKPGLIERFKETRAYDKLQEEVSSLGERFVEELSSVGRNVVLPALFAKVKDMFGVDLSGKQGRQGALGASSSGATGQASGAAGGGATGSGGTSGAGPLGGANAGGASSYATSENRGY